MGFVYTIRCWVGLRQISFTSRARLPTPGTGPSATIDHGACRFASSAPAGRRGRSPNSIARGTSDRGARARQIGRSGLVQARVGAASECADHRVGEQIERPPLPSGSAPNERPRSKKKTSKRTRARLCVQTGALETRGGVAIVDPVGLGFLFVRDSGLRPRTAVSAGGSARSMHRQGTAASDRRAGMSGAKPTPHSSAPRGRFSLFPVPSF